MNMIIDVLSLFINLVYFTLISSIGWVVAIFLYIMSLVVKWILKRVWE